VIGSGPPFQVRETPRVVRKKDRVADNGLTGINYDVTADGKRIVALMPVETPETQKAQTHVIFLENFFDELRRKVPLAK
jgi:hypothetical protein